MTTTIEQLREQLAAVCTTADGVLGLKNVPEKVDRAALAVVRRGRIPSYRESYQRGHWRCEFDIDCVSPIIAETAAAERQLDAMLSPTGAGSVVQALENDSKNNRSTDKVLGGKAIQTIVESAGATELLTLGGKRCLVATLNIYVNAKGA